MTKSVSMLVLWLALTLQAVVCCLPQTGRVWTTCVNPAGCPDEKPKCCQRCCGEHDDDELPDARNACSACANRPVCCVDVPSAPLMHSPKIFGDSSVAAPADACIAPELNVACWTPHDAAGHTQRYRWSLPPPTASLAITSRLRL